MDVTDDIGNYATFWIAFCAFWAEDKGLFGSRMRSHHADDG
jgi:hypothetical protein